MSPPSQSLSSGMQSKACTSVVPALAPPVALPTGTWDGSQPETREPARNTRVRQCGEDEFPSLQSQADLFISKKERRKKTQQTSRPQASSAVGVSAARWCCNLGSPENLFQQIGNVEDAKSSRRLWLLEIPQGRAQAL